MFANLKDQRPKTKDLSLRAEKGFTLIELLIVIVIIGLIVAGVVGGQALVEPAKIRSQLAQIKQYEVAYNTFILEYNAIPGDFNRASQYWTGITDGDNNGRVTGDSDHASNLSNENVLFFTHLSEAQLNQENFSHAWQLNVGYPSLKLNSNKGMVAASSRANHAQYQASAVSVKALLDLNVGRPTAGGTLSNDVLGTGTPKIHSIIDTKIDDGKASEGKYIGYRVFNSSYGNCLDGFDGDYLLSNDQFACHALYILEK